MASVSSCLNLFGKLEIGLFLVDEGLEFVHADAHWRGQGRGRAADPVCRPEPAANPAAGPQFPSGPSAPAGNTVAGPPRSSPANPAGSRRGPASRTDRPGACSGNSRARVRRPAAEFRLASRKDGPASVSHAGACHCLR